MKWGQFRGIESKISAVIKGFLKKLRNTYEEVQLLCSHVERPSFSYFYFNIVDFYINLHKALPKRILGTIWN